MTNIKTGEKNRALNCLTVSNLKLDDVFSDVFGKSSASIIQYLLEHPGESFDVTPFVHKGCKKPIEEIQAAVDGAISESQIVKLRQCLTHINELEIHRNELDQEVQRLASSFRPVLELLRTIPGLSANPMTAIAILSEVGPDMSLFQTAKHLISWAGCCTRNDQSGGRVKSTRISRAGYSLNPLLVQIANALLKSKNHPEFKNRYRRIKANRGHKKAIIAIFQMLLTAIWNVLSKVEPYTNEGYLDHKPVEKEKVLSQSQALEFLRKRGYVITEANAGSG